MDEFKVSGIVLSSGDYKEKDILITIFTVELGKIKAVLKGAKQSKAKFRFAGQPFCFAEWVLVKRGECFVVTNVSLYDAFYDLASDYDSFLIASAMNEVCIEVLKPGIINERLFLLYINALKHVVYEKSPAKLVFCKFLLELLVNLGYGLQFKFCGVCNMPITSDIILSATTFDFECISCSAKYGVQVNKREYNMLKIISNSTWESLKTIKISETLMDLCVGVLKYDIQNILGHKFNTF